MKRRLNVFCFRFSLQAGVVFICCFGLVFHSIALMKLCFYPSPETETKYIFASYFLAVVFIVVGYIAYIVGLIGAAIEEPGLVKVAGWFLVFELIYWVVLTILSFTNTCSIVRSVCVDNRCAERLYIQNGYWRTSIRDCKNETIADRGTTTDIVPVSADSVTQSSKTTLSRSAGAGVRNRVVHGKQPDIILRKSHCDKDEVSLDEQIHLLLKNLKLLNENLSGVIQANQLRNSGRNIDNHASLLNGSGSNERADEVSFERGIPIKTDIHNHEHPVAKSGAHNNETLDLNQTTFMKNGRYPYRPAVQDEWNKEGVHNSKANKSVNPLFPNSVITVEKRKNLNMTKAENSHRENNKNRTKREEKQNYDGMTNKISLSQLNREVHATPILSSRMTKVILGEAHITTELAESEFTGKNMITTRSHNISYDEEAKSPIEPSYKHIQAIPNGSELWDLSEFTSTQKTKEPMLNRWREEKYVNKSINQSAGRAFGRKAGEAPELPSVAYVLTSIPRKKIECEPVAISGTDYTRSYYLPELDADPADDDITFLFTARATSDARFKLTAIPVADKTPEESPGEYIKVNLGWNQNTRIGLERHPKRSGKDWVDVPWDSGHGLISAIKMTAYKLELKGQHLRLYAETLPEPLLVYKDYSVALMKYISFSAYNNVTGQFCLNCQEQCFPFDPDASEAEDSGKPEINIPGSDNTTTPKYGNITTSENGNITTSENDNITTPENDITSSEGFTEIEDTTSNFAPTRTVRFPVHPRTEKDSARPRAVSTPIGDTGSQSHLILSIIYAITILILWYIYPILVIFSFADELIVEEEEALMQTSGSNLEGMGLDSSSPTEA